MRWNRRAMWLACSVSCGVVAVFLGGCGGKSPAERLIGKWQGQVELNEAAVTEELAKSGDDANARLVFDALKSMQVDIEFKADGSLWMAAEAKTPEGADAQSVKGKWEVVSHEGDQITIQSLYEGEQKPERIEITLEGDNSFSTRPPGPNHEIGVLRMKRMR